MDPVSNTQGQVQAAGHHHHHHGGGQRAKAVDDSVAQALGMSSSDVESARRQGQSLSDLTQAKGVSQDALLGAIQQGLQKADPNLSADRAQQIASRIASHSGGEPAGVAPAAADDGSQGGFSVLAASANAPATPPWSIDASA
jgi:hypothetical protein